ncbi:hypothetical protein FHW12_000561 [Dokdonella fugitiva]|uniref:DOT1 domain-containing protein n=1 Tax=Dokdonella fugitiva TaxID=328517 RepID=A0A839EZP2_9GAMM|nr:class I SAM-dependent methyltransferase [Dokdonella fugitiva]MBA8886370.1 hypothetical protein [Dokdonella fugitiva]
MQPIDGRAKAGARRAWIEHLERDAVLEVPERLRERAEVLDQLDLHFHGSPESASGEPDLHRRASALRDRLEAVDRRLCADLRVDLCNGCGGERLLRFANGSAASGDHYDYLDDLVAGVLQLEAPGDVPDPGPDMVFYQPTPARHVFELIARTPLGADDVFVDLGSGLGHVPLLVGACSAARALGVELQAAYVERARAAATALCLDRVTFVEQDARAADFSEGTVFYLYTPFGGSILRTVLDALRAQAERRAIRICSYGPCTATVEREAWLKARTAETADRIAVFESLPG